MKVLTDEVIASFKDAARKLTGPKRRAFQAQVTLDYLDGSMWKAERVFGWSHHTVALGLNELRTVVIYSQHCCTRCRKYFNADMTDLAAPGSHSTKRVVDTAVRLVIEDG